MANVVLPSAKTALSAAASVAASAVLIRTIVNDLIPAQLQHYFLSSIYGLFDRQSSRLVIVIEEYNGFSRNEIYEAAQVYLGSKISPSTRRLKVMKPEKEKNFTVTVERNEEVVDAFHGIQVKWRLVSREVESTAFRHSFNHTSPTFKCEIRYYELSFHKRHREGVLGSYLKFVVEKAKAMKEKVKTVKIHALRYELLHRRNADVWSSVNFDHPATFETLAMDPELKSTLMEDLKRFVERKEYYKRAGKAWKRGYLLYGPPGTGKSSLIAAMAKFLNFNVYDLELTDLRCNSELKNVLMATANRSIIVIEDIDCTIDLQSRENQNQSQLMLDYQGNQQVSPTLSGLLNFIDGLWTSCGEERILVFTTNHKDKLDPALLRPGRMDMHIHMTYLSPGGFEVLASNYLGIQSHKLIPQIHQLLSELQVTPAQVAEELMKNSDEPDVCLGGLIDFLHVKRREKDEAMDEQEKDVAVAEQEKDLEQANDGKKDGAEEQRVGQSSPMNVRRLGPRMIRRGRVTYVRWW